MTRSARKPARATSMGLENLRFILVGAGGGIGSALARRLRRAGAETVLMGRNPERLALLGQELDAPTRAVDAANGPEFEAALADFGPVRGIVNCAGSVLLKRGDACARALGQTRTSCVSDRLVGRSRKRLGHRAGAGCRRRTRYGALATARSEKGPAPQARSKPQASPFGNRRWSSPE
jgi:shikimate 5-dehydrogenase